MTGVDSHWHCSSTGWNERPKVGKLMKLFASTATREHRPASLASTKGGDRLYHQHVVERLPTAHHCYLAARQGACHCEQLKQSMREQQQAIHQKIAALQKLQKELGETMEGWVHCGGHLDAKLM